MGAKWTKTERTDFIQNLKNSAADQREELTGMKLAKLEKLLAKVTLICQKGSLAIREGAKNAREAIRGEINRRAMDGILIPNRNRKAYGNW